MDHLKGLNLTEIVNFFFFFSFIALLKASPQNVLKFKEDFRRFWAALSILFSEP